MNISQTNSKNHFCRVYDKYAGIIYGLILKFITDRNTADRILENVFNTYLKTGDQTNNLHKHPFTILFFISRNLILKESNSLKENEVDLMLNKVFKNYSNKPISI